MTVYVDDAAIRARVPYAGREIVGTWYHLIADTQEELHDFARALGLARSWFQEPKGIGGKPAVPESLSAQNWHYDITAPKRIKAIQLGARPVTQEQMRQIILDRYDRLHPHAAKQTRERTHKIMHEFLDQHPELKPDELPFDEPGRS